MKMTFYFIFEPYVFGISRIPSNVEKMVKHVIIIHTKHVFFGKYFPSNFSSQLKPASSLLFSFAAC